MDIQDLIYSIRTRESDWPVHDGIKAVGDNGKSYGPLQISRAAWVDAMSVLDQKDRFEYVECGNWRPSIVVFLAYMHRYRRNHLGSVIALGKSSRLDDSISMMRCWNGGPDGRPASKTEKYSKNVLEAYAKILELDRRKLYDNGDSEFIYETYRKITKSNGGEKVMVETQTATKPWYRSKTLITNLGLILGGVAAIISEFSIGGGVGAAVVGGINIVLRFLTNTGISN